MKKISLLFLFILLGIGKNYAQETGVKTTAAPFLRIAPDARSGGLADMGVATTTDANSQFFNAAKYAFMTSQYNVGINYTPWMRNLSNDTFLGSAVFATRINERSSWSAGIRYFSYGDIETSDIEGNITGIENPSDLAIGGSYSLKLSENFSMGVGMKYLRSDFSIKSQNTDLNTVNSFAVDLGGYYQSAEKNYGNFNGIWRAGFNFSNIGPKVKLTDGGAKSPIPTNLGMGGAFEFIFDDTNSITTSLEANQLIVSDVDFGDMTWAISAEYDYSRVFALRMGYLFESEDIGGRDHFTLGGGFNFKNSSIDFSYLINTSDVNSPLENTLRFSISFDFGEVYENIIAK